MLNLDEDEEGWNWKEDTVSQRRNRIRHSMSLVNGLVFVVLGIAYFNPDDLVRNPNPASRGNRSSVVVYIENLTVVPVWGIAFTVAGVLMLLAVFHWCRYLPPAHLVCGCVMVGYTVAAYTTAVINEGTYIVSATIAGLVAVLNLLLMLSYTSPQDAPKGVGTENDEESG